MNKKIEVNDYVEPISDMFNAVDLKEYDITDEDLCGFVTEKQGNLITVQGIGSGVETTWNENKFVIAEVPEIFKGDIRIRK